MAAKKKPRAKPSAIQIAERAERARALLAALEVSQGAFEGVSGLVRNNVSAALRGKSAFTSAKWVVGFHKLTGVPEEAIRRYLLDGEVTLEDLLASRDNASLLQTDTKEFLESLHAVKGIQAFIDGEESPVPLGDVVGVLAAIRSGTAASYANPEGRFDLPRLFRDYRRNKLKAGRPTGTTAGADRAAREQAEELGRVPPKKISFGA